MPRCPGASLAIGKEIHFSWKKHFSHYIYLYRIGKRDILQATNEWMPFYRDADEVFSETGRIVATTELSADATEASRVHWLYFLASACLSVWWRRIVVVVVVH